jgi:tyrosyl-tRNA synthetase
VENNPILDYARFIILPYLGSISIVLKDGPVEYVDAAVLEADYAAAKIHPSELKPAVTSAINSILEPVRKHFESGEPKALLDKIKTFKITK